MTAPDSPAGDREARTYTDALTKRRRQRWCYECQTYTFTHKYPTQLLEEVIELCDPCAADLARTAPASGGVPGSRTPSAEGTEPNTSGVPAAHDALREHIAVSIEAAFTTGCEHFDLAPDGDPAGCCWTCAAALVVEHLSADAMLDVLAASASPVPQGSVMVDAKDLSDYMDVVDGRWDGAPYNIDPTTARLRAALTTPEGSTGNE